MVVRRYIVFTDVCAHANKGEICTVSHRWMARHEPDADGTQLKVVKAHVRAHRASIKLVWYDAWCLPQGVRTPAEELEFKTMLREVNLLYLGMSVLILLDLSYQSRFWVRGWRSNTLGSMAARAADAQCDRPVCLRSSRRSSNAGSPSSTSARAACAPRLTRRSVPRS